MEAFFSPEIQAGIRAAQNRDLKTSNRLCVHVEDGVYKIDTLSENGFEIAKDRAPKLRGSIDIYDGPRHLFHALIIYSEVDGDVIRYEFKQIKQARDAAPKDYVRETPAPIALLR